MTEDNLEDTIALYFADVKCHPLLDRKEEVELAKTVDEIGEEFGLSRERIRQIETSGLRKLAHPIRSRSLRSYLKWKGD